MERLIADPEDARQPFRVYCLRDRSTSTKPKPTRSRWCEQSLGPLWRNANLGKRPPMALAGPSTRRGPPGAWRRNGPPAAISSECVPRSTTLPCSIMTTRSARSMADVLCATTSTARFTRDRFDRIEDAFLAFGVEMRGRLVEDEQRPVAQHGAGDGDALPFAAGEPLAALPDHGAQPIGSCRNSSPRPDLCRASMSRSSVASSRPYRRLSRSVASRR